jgi:hypothetical protein
MRVEDHTGLRDGRQMIIVSVTSNSVSGVDVDVVGTTGTSR